MSENKLVDVTEELDTPVDIPEVAVVETPAELDAPVFKCPRCGQMKPRDAKDQHICVDCAKLYRSRYSFNRTNQPQWMDNAKANGIDLWVQQPGETQWEYTVWCAYRDSYPGKKPSYSDVAKQLLMTTAAVQHIAKRWDFTIRMQAWIAESQRATLAQRRQEILDMNKDHISMSQKLRAKLNTAIDLVDPMALKPSEIVSLAKLSADMERTAMTDSISQEEMRGQLLVEQENPNIKKSPTKQSDLSEVVQILMKAGALGDITTIGVKETKTTQVVVNDADGNAAGITMDD